MLPPGQDKELHSLGEPPPYHTLKVPLDELEEVTIAKGLNISSETVAQKTVPTFWIQSEDLTVFGDALVRRHAADIELKFRSLAIEHSVVFRVEEVLRWV